MHRLFSYIFCINNLVRFQAWILSLIKSLKQRRCCHSFLVYSHRCNQHGRWNLRCFLLLYASFPPCEVQLFMELRSSLLLKRLFTDRRNKILNFRMCWLINEQSLPESFSTWLILFSKLYEFVIFMRFDIVFREIHFFYGWRLLRDLKKEI